jgi:RNA polymerase sigma factor (sigma-70 family)
VRRYSPRVFRIAGKFFRQRALVEDAAQEAFLKVYTQLSSYQGRGSFEGWLTRLTANQCINMLRSAKRRPEFPVSDLTEDEARWLETHSTSVFPAPHQSIERSLVASDLAEKVLGQLAPDDRFVLISIDGDHLPVKEVAEMIGWSESKVKVRAFRARRRLRQTVDKLLSRIPTRADERQE